MGRVGKTKDGQAENDQAGDVQAGEANRQQISLPLAVLAPLVLVGAFIAGATTIGLSTEVLILAMLAAAATAGLVAVGRGASWEDIERETGKKFAAVLPVVLILLAIGALIGTWVLSGTIPMLVALGVDLISPRFFVLTTFLVTCLMSICTGTSWGSAGTLGVALMGAGAALGAPLDATAGAVVSGAYFGDKMSPLSDSTNICALGAGAGLYAHIRHMLYTSVPSFVVALVVFAVFAAPASGDASTAPAAARLLADVNAQFSIGLVALLPLVLVLAGVVARKPAALVLATSCVLAMTIGVVQQGFSVEAAMLSAVSGFDVSMFDGPLLDGSVIEGALLDEAMLGSSGGPAEGTAEGGAAGNGAASSEQRGELFLSLVNRGGMYSMANTLIVIIAAFLLAAAMETSGALRRILEALLSGVRSTFGLVASTMAAGATLVSLTSHAGVTALIVGGMFQPAFAQRKLAPVNLSRSLEDSVTMVEALLPWTVSAIFFTTTLGVGTLEYAPWAVFNWCSPIASLVLAALARRWGFGIQRIA